jgi:ATP-dependent helicase/nuclease subunit A
MKSVADPQVLASDPRASTFVAANAGSGKTSTLVKRVARLLLAGATPEAILCVTYTKAGAAEMQRRLFQDLGDWAMMSDPKLTEALAKIDEHGRDLSAARALFARALETPGGLKIQTLHAFCEKLLRRFPLEAGVSPGFTVLEDQAAEDVSKRAREDVARFALDQPNGPIGTAYAHFSIELDWQNFNDLLAGFETKRLAIAAYVDKCGNPHGAELDVWKRCGFERPTSPAAVEAEAMRKIRWIAWRRAADALLATGMSSDRERGVAMKAVTPDSAFAEVATIFLTVKGEARQRLGTKSLDPRELAWLIDEQERAVRTHGRWLAASVARDTVHALTLATAYASLYEGAKTAKGGLDFGDLIAHAHGLLTQKANAAWVLYKLDGGIEHVLLDEGQDTAPQQWEILRALTAEFFTGAGAGPAGRTLFAVADEKQSIFSFQGAAPERFAVEKQAFATTVKAAGERFSEISLTESWRSTPEILTFVDSLFKPAEALAGLRPASGEGVRLFPITHRPRRGRGGCVELWPLDATDEVEEDDPWAPVNIEPKESAGRKLARRIAGSIRAMVARQQGVGERGTDKMRPCAFGDVLILVRRRNALFHEVIRALKREGVPVGGADRLKLSEHGVFEDLMALARFTRFPTDDLTLAALLRGPFCDVDEESLFDLAHDRQGSLWSSLDRRSGERSAWGAAASFLGWARGEAERAAPFDFFGRALSRLDGEGRSMRQRLLTRMGAEGEDALEAFLAQALASEGHDVRDLETFVARLSASDVEVKREQEDTGGRGGGAVRVMTVHGAKGLEAPIVILPDTTTRATDRGGALMETADGGFLWAPRKADDCPASAQARERRAKAAEGESSRLLYVALTRARDRLIVCGVESRPHLHERSWYDYVQRAFDALPIRPFALEDGGEGWRYGPDPVPAAAAEDGAAAVLALPAWTRGLAPAESALARFVSPSALREDDKGASPSPLTGVKGLGRFRRGELIHRLLQLLPDIAEDGREAAARSLLKRQSDLTQAQRAEMAAAALAVLADPQFTAVFGPGSKAEVALAGAAARLPRGLAISGRVDRLVVEVDRVLVIDFKTNRPAPARIEDADDAYILQMAVYAAVLAEIFPERKIEAALVWTDGPALMAVPEKLLSAALDELATKA